MTVKELIEKLQTLDQDKQIGYCDESEAFSWSINGVDFDDGLGMYIIN